MCSLHRLLPIICESGESSADFVFIDDNAKRPRHSFSEASLKERQPPKKTNSKSKNRWETLAPTSVVPLSPTKDATMMTTTSDVSPTNSPSGSCCHDEEDTLVEEALAKATKAFFGGDMTNNAPLSPPAGREDQSLRSSIEARKPCRRPSVEQDKDIWREITEELLCESPVGRNSDGIIVGDGLFRSSLSAKQPQRKPFLDLA